MRIGSTISSEQKTSQREVDGGEIVVLGFTDLKDKTVGC